MSAADETAPRRLPSEFVALTPGTLERSRSGSATRLLEAMERAVAASIEGGLRSIVVREPSLEDGAFLELAQRLRARLDAAAPGEGWLAVHDRVHLAAASGADAVHLGGTSLPSAAARSVVGSAVAIGVSSHDADGEDYPGADFHLHAPAFPPTSKQLYGRAVLGWEGLESFAEATERPVFALGGITIERLQERAEARCEARLLAGVALIGGLWGTDQTPLSSASGPLLQLASISRAAAKLTELCATLFRVEGEATP